MSRGGLKYRGHDVWLWIAGAAYLLVMGGWAVFFAWRAWSAT